MTTHNREFWRALEEQADDPAFREVPAKGISLAASKRSLIPSSAGRF